MTDEQISDGDAADPLVSWRSIPGAGGSTGGDDEQDSESPDSAYARVRGLLSEPGPPVGANSLSEKMTEEMKSFDERWNQRPVSTLVAAGKKMADSPDSPGVNRLLGLSTPAATTPDPETANDDPVPETTAADPDVAEQDTGHQDVDAVRGELQTPITEMSTFDRTELDDKSSEPGDELLLDPLPLVRATSRLETAQQAYAALNPVEAEIFCSHAKLVSSEQVAAASSRAQGLALETLRSYEREMADLQDQLATVRAQAQSSAGEATTRESALTTEVATLKGQLELANAQLAAARRADTDDGDDSGGGAGRQVVKGHDDLRSPDDEASGDTDDRSEDDDAESDEPDIATVEPPELVGDEILAAATDHDAEEGSVGMVEALQRLAQGEDAPLSQHDLGDEGTSR
ncbi:MAG: hypothetical protein DI630_00680 [Gordonia sp. (in: high G+C Gram-positive bacteria)]|nr:MAG: hypothetical protein DI630_00680 [Gordonia sp. (in: high G+C Gram-positive bacteria)]